MEAWLAQASEEELAEAGLFPGDDASVAADVWETDLYTMENIIVSSANCVAEAEEAATALVAASATLLAAALLN